MALPSNDKIIGDLGHTDDHNLIVNEISYIKDNYISASSNFLTIYLREDTASATYFPISASATLSLQGYLTASAAANTYLRQDSASATYLQISASSNYLFSSTASSLYLRRDSASAIYLTISSSSTFLRQDSASAIYAKINSPNFTGIPTGPTASAGSSTSQLATTQFVATAILQAQTGSAVDLSSYMTFSAASSLYLPISSSSSFLTNNSVIDCGGP